MMTDTREGQLVVVLREPTGRHRVVYVWGGAWIEDDVTGVRYAYTKAVETTHGVAVLVADRLYGPTDRDLQRWVRDYK